MRPIPLRRPPTGLTPFFLVAAALLMAQAIPPSTAPATQPAVKPLPPSIIAILGGPSVDQQSARAFQKSLGSTPEEWKVIKPLLDKVQTAAAALHPDDAPPAIPWSRGDWSNGSFTGPGESAAGVRPRWGAPKPDPAAAPATQPAPDPEPSATLARDATLHQALSDLKKLIDTPAVSDAALHRQVETVRLARRRAQAALDAARAELLPLLTPRQEATLVSLGYLDE